jgi:uncharacterized protein
VRDLTPDEIEDFLDAQVVGRIGCHADGVTYVVPVTYARSDGAIYVASIEGQKVRMMRENPEVCFEVDEYRDGRWRSVIAQGVYEELDGAASQHALDVLAARFRSSGRRPRRPASGRPPVCFRILVREVTGRTV